MERKKPTEQQGQKHPIRQGDQGRRELLAQEEIRDLIRKEYGRQRDLLPENEVCKRSKAIVESIVSSRLFLEAGTVFFYYPLRQEVDLLAAAARALEMGKLVGFPRTEGQEIRFYKVQSLEAFSEGRFHVMEPVGAQLIEEESPLILVPGVAFDEEKNRMGYGKGYYDRYLARAPQAVKVGVAYEMQIAPKICSKGYDIPMDYIVTENRMW